jgi:hypothetical protein
MNEKEALARMVAPGGRRGGIWRGGILQIHVTRACDKACFGCTQGSNLGGKPVMISPEEFEQAVLSLKGYFGVVGVFGGNPVMHPQFDYLCSILREHVPFNQRGVWCNHPRGKGPTLRKTFDPAVSNLNVHLDRQAHDEFWRDWPEARRVLKGLDVDSRHSPPFVAMRDVLPDEGKRWELISSCDVNQHWSAMICSVPGKGLRAFFCELAGAMAMLHSHEEDWPDLGLEVTPGWWKKSMQDFKEQVRFYCHRCGIPLRRFGQLAVNGECEEVSPTHEGIYKPKERDRKVALVALDALDGRRLARVTDYVQNGALS